MAIRAIETCYQGIRFRSRLEARWAIFFDTLGVPWDYEREGYDFGPDLRYLPDFWLPSLDCWVEIKPQFPGHGSIECAKALALACKEGHTVFLFYACAPLLVTPEVDILNGGHYFCPCGDFDGMQLFGFCSACHMITLGHFGTHMVHYCTTMLNDTSLALTCNGGDHDHHRVREAFAAARAARFYR